MRGLGREEIHFNTSSHVVVTTFSTCQLLYIRTSQHQHSYFWISIIIIRNHHTIKLINKSTCLHSSTSQHHQQHQEARPEVASFFHSHETDNKLLQSFQRSFHYQQHTSSPVFLVVWQQTERSRNPLFTKATSWGFSVSCGRSWLS